MFRGSSKALALAGVAVAVVLAAPASAQSNPFIPSSGPSKAELQKLEQRLKALEENQSKGPSGPPVGVAPGAPMPGAPVAPGGPMPGAPVGAPMGPSGAAVPGGMMPPGGLPGAPGVPGVPGAPGAPGVIEAPKGAIEAAQEGGVRFLGCINGEPKFVQKSGLRARFTAKEIRDAVKAGFVPECR